MRGVVIAVAATIVLHASLAIAGVPPLADVTRLFIQYSDARHHDCWTIEVDLKDGGWRRTDQRGCLSSDVKPVDHVEHGTLTADDRSAIARTYRKLASGVAKACDRDGYLITFWLADGTRVNRKNHVDPCTKPFPELVTNVAPLARVLRSLTPAT